MTILHSSFKRILKHPFVLFFILFLLLTGLGLYTISIIKSPQISNGSYDVRLKINITNENLTDIYLYNEKSGGETKLLTISDVYRDHYHAAEFTDNTLYIIKRTGGSEGYITNTNWTDELWIYKNNSRGKKLYSARGIDFRVMPDTKVVGIVSGEAMNEIVVMMNQDGTILKTIDRINIGLENDDSILEPFMWRDGVFWLNTRQSLALIDLISIDTIDFFVFKRDVSDLHIAGNEFALDPTSKFLVFSDYVPSLDVQDVNNIHRQLASIYLYDLDTNEKKTLLTAYTNHPFEPVWNNTSTLEYNDPNGQGRVEMSFHR